MPLAPKGRRPVTPRERGAVVDLDLDVGDADCCGVRDHEIASRLGRRGVGPQAQQQQRIADGRRQAPARFFEPRDARGDDERLRRLVEQRERVGAAALPLLPNGIGVGPQSRKAWPRVARVAEYSGAQGWR